MFLPTALQNNSVALDLKKQVRCLEQLCNAGFLLVTTVSYYKFVSGTLSSKNTSLWHATTERWHLSIFYNQYFLCFRVC